MKKVFFIIFLLFVFLVSCGKNNDDNNVINNETSKNVQIYDKDNTEIYNDKYKINGESMMPLVENGSIVDVKINYYNGGQNSIKSGDVVIFENPHNLDKIIKKILIIPNDEVVYNEKDQTLKVNNKILKNSVGKEYIFTKNQFKMINIYIKEGKIIPNMYFVFGDNINNSIDSRSFGPITNQGILGKVEL